MAHETDDQARADQSDDQQSVNDPSDALNNTHGGDESPLSQYEREVEAALAAEVRDGNDDDQEQSEHGGDDDEGASDQDQDDDETGEESEGEETEDSEDEEEAEPEAKVPDRFRFKSDEDKAVAAMAKAKGISLVEAARMYAGEAAPAATRQGETPPRSEDAEKAESSAALDARIEALFEEKLEAIELIDVTRQKELEREIRDLEKRSAALKLSEVQEQSITKQKQMERFNSEYDGNWEKAVRMYPDLKNPQSPIYKRMAEIDAEAKKNGDPLFNDSRKPWLFAVEAAKDTGTRMRKDSSPGKTGKKATSFKPAGGNASTTATNPAKRAEEAIEGIQSMRDYQDMVASL